MKYFLLLFTFLLISCSKEVSVYNLSVSSKLDPSLQIHIATFDSEQGEEYRKNTCLETAQLLQENSSGLNSYKCESSLKK